LAIGNYQSLGNHELRLPVGPVLSEWDCSRIHR